MLRALLVFDRREAPPARFGVSGCAEVSHRLDRLEERHSLPRLAVRVEEVQARLVPAKPVDGSPIPRRHVEHGTRRDVARLGIVGEVTKRPIAAPRDPHLVGASTLDCQSGGEGERGALALPGADEFVRQLNAAWWSGIVPTPDGGQQVVTFEDALAFKVVHPATECLGAVGSWSGPGEGLA